MPFDAEQEKQMRAAARVRPPMPNFNVPPPAPMDSPLARLAAEASAPRIEPVIGRRTAALLAPPAPPPTMIEPTLAAPAASPAAAQSPVARAANYGSAAPRIEPTLNAPPPRAEPHTVPPNPRPSAPASNPPVNPNTGIGSGRPIPVNSAGQGNVFSAEANDLLKQSSKLPDQVGRPTLVTQLRQAVGLVDNDSSRAINGGRPTPALTVEQAALQDAKRAAKQAKAAGKAGAATQSASTATEAGTTSGQAKAAPGAVRRTVQAAVGSADDWKQFGSKVGAKAGSISGAASRVGQALAPLAPLAKLGGAGLGGVSGVVGIADGIREKDNGKIALGALDTAAAGALYTPAAPAAAVYLTGRGAYGLGQAVNKKMPVESQDSVGNLINTVVHGAGKLVGQEWGEDGTNYNKMRELALQQQAARAAGKPDPTAMPVKGKQQGAAAQTKQAAAQTKQAAAQTKQAAAQATPPAAPPGGGGRGTGGGGAGSGAAGGANRGRKIAAAAAGAAALPAVAALSPQDAALAAQVAGVGGGLGPDGQDRGTIYTLQDGSSFTTAGQMTPEQQAIAAAHRANLLREGALYEQQIAAGQRQEPVVIDGGMATTMSGNVMPQSVYNAGMAQQYADTANQAAVREADPRQADIDMFADTEGKTRLAVAGTQAGAQISSATIAAEAAKHGHEIQYKQPYMRLDGGTDRQTGMAMPDRYIDNKTGKEVTPPTYKFPSKPKIQRLINNPHEAPLFDAEFGPGAAARILLPLEQRN